MEPILSGDWLIHWWSISKGYNSCSIVFYYPRLLTAGGPTLTTFVDQCNSRTNLIISPLLGDGEYITKTYLYLMRETTQVDSTETADTGLSIAGQGRSLPPNIALLSSFRPAVPIPRRVSRKYWPFSRSDFLTSGGKVNAAGQAAVDAVAAAYLLTIDFGGSGFSVRVRAGFKGKFPYPGELFSTTKTSEYWATQKRRVRGSQKKSWDG
jgi:hypothetical protein